MNKSDENLIALQIAADAHSQILSDFKRGQPFLTLKFFRDRHGITKKTANSSIISWKKSKHENRFLHRSADLPRSSVRGIRHHRPIRFPKNNQSNLLHLR